MSTNGVQDAYNYLAGCGYHYRVFDFVDVGSLAVKKSGESAEDFFLSGRSMPWWLLGVSMVACTFSCDTPNLVTELVRLNGVAGNWVWWAFLLTGMLTVFVYANLWRRSGLNTDLGFYELRYSGKPAAFLRGFRAIYLGVVYNLIILGAVSLAAIKIGQIMFGLTPVMSLVYAMSGVAVYATLGGLTGSIWADFYQFAVAMAGAIFAAWYAVKSGMTDGGTTLKELIANPALTGKLSFIPPLSGDLSTLMTVLILPLAVQWWNVWYPLGARRRRSSRSACCPPRTSGMRSAGRCFSMCCTTRSGRGRGYWWRWHRWWCSR